MKIPMTESKSRVSQLCSYLNTASDSKRRKVIDIEESFLKEAGRSHTIISPCTYGALQVDLTIGGNTIQQEEAV